MRNIPERGILLADNAVLDLEQLPQEIVSLSGRGAAVEPTESILPLEQVEARYLRQVAVRFPVPQAAPVTRGLNESGGVMSSSWLNPGVLLVLFGLCGSVNADLPLLNGNLQVPVNGTQRYESSADILLQLPAQVDPLAPVPLGVRVFQEQVRSITLLTDEVEPVQLAQFELGPGTRPELSTRLKARDGGVLVVVRTDNRIIASRRGYTLVGEPAVGQEERADQGSGVTQDPDIEPTVAADASTATPALPEAESAETMQGMELRAWRGKDLYFVELRPSEPLTALMQHLDAEARAATELRRFEIFQEDNRLLGAIVSDGFWYRPYFRFSFSEGDIGDELVLSWQDSNGIEGQLSTTIAESD